jgi:hypothetical protein
MVRQVFIFGEFISQQRLSPPLTIGSPLQMPPATVPGLELSTEAIEILREPSVLEVIGKIYVLTSNRNYQPVTPLGVRNFNWYREYQTASRTKDKFFFKAKEGDLWHVPWMRQESDESGAYIAVGLKHD